MHVRLLVLLFLEVPLEGFFFTVVPRSHLHAHPCLAAATKRRRTILQRNGQHKATTTPPRIIPCNANTSVSSSLRTTKLNQSRNKRYDDDESSSSSGDDQPILIRITSQLGKVLTRPTVASLPGGVLLALIVLPFVQSLFQTLLSLSLFTGLSVLGRRLNQQDDEDDDALQVVTNENNEETSSSTAWTDTFAIIFGGAAGYLLLPSSTATTPFNNGSANPGPTALGFGVLAAALAVLWQTSDFLDQDDDDDQNKYEGKKINGVDKELLIQWDEEMKYREMQQQSLQRKKDDE